MAAGSDDRVLREENHFQRMTVIVQDMGMHRDDDENPLIAQVSVPTDRLLPGPRTHRFHVVDVDLSEGVATVPADLAGEDGWSYRDRFAKVTRYSALTNTAFHAQNTYAIAARTLATFERLLGRRVPWAFDSPVLNIVPRAMAEANAYYSRDDHALLFGYMPGTTKRNRVLTCLSHDIIAHEVTHAVLDGLRPRLVEPGLPDQPAFHEALADIVALLSILSIDRVVYELLPAAPDGSPDRIEQSKVRRDRLERTVLFGLAEEFGNAVHDDRREALRRSVNDVPDDDGWKDLDAHPEFIEPHRRAEIVVAAVMRSFLDMWVSRLEAYKSSVRERVAGAAVLLDRARVAEEGAKAAEHLLGMVVRSIDYLPPVEVEFGDVIEAILVADEVMVPDDRYDYRTALRDRFDALGVCPPKRTMTDQVALRPDDFDYRFVNIEALATSAEEVYRFMWQNMTALGLDPDVKLSVDRVVTSSRSGPYGLVVNEIVADYSQVADLTAGELHKVGIRRGKIPPDTRIQLWGGGVLVFDQFGRLRQHKAKRIFGDVASRRRQTERLRYLHSRQLSGRDGSYGASLNISRGERFASLHAATEEEAW
ncbi:MAG: hypothetical protein AAF548_08245 [Actinomycetota bacterium]